MHLADAKFLATITLFLFLGASGCQKNNLASSAIVAATVPVKLNAAEAETAASCDSSACPHFNRSIILEVEPQRESGLAPQFIDAVDVKGMSVNAATLQPSVHFNGQVEKFALLSKSDIKIPFKGWRTDVSAILSAPLLDVSAFKSKILTTTTVDDQGKFSLKLAAEHRYLLIINSNGENNSAPSFYDYFAQKNEAQFFAAVGPSQISGFVELADGNDELPTLSIRAMQDGRQVSSAAEIKSQGNFSLRMSSPLFSKSQEISLEISPSTKESSGPFWSKKYSFTPGSSLDVASIKLKTGALIEQKITILNNAGNPISNAHIFLLSHDAENIYGISKHDYFSASDGSVTVKMPNRKYLIAVIPPHDSQHAAMRSIISLDNAVVLKLGDRAALSGKIISHSNEALEGAKLEISCTYADEKFAQILPSVQFSVEATSNKNGNWCGNKSRDTNHECSAVWLDAGSCRALASAAVGSMMPLQSKKFSFPQESLLNVQLPKAQILTGQLRSPDSNSSAGKAYVRIYVRKNENEHELLAQTFSDEKGNYTAYVRPDF